MTPLQELLSELMQVRTQNPFIETTVNLILDMVASKLKNETKMIQEAYENGKEKGYEIASNERYS
jgi:hypothetical protein